MSNSFVPVAIAHDATCKKGEEWMFHGFGKNHDCGESLLDENIKNLLDDDMDEMKKHYDGENAIPEDWECDDDFSWCGCIMALGFVVFVVGVAIWALT